VDCGWGWTHLLKLADAARARELQDGANAGNREERRSALDQNAITAVVARTSARDRGHSIACEIAIDIIAQYRVSRCASVNNLVDSHIGLP
jgi:hypothetical protein